MLRGAVRENVYQINDQLLPYLDVLLNLFSLIFIDTESSAFFYISYKMVTGKFHISIRLSISPFQTPLITKACLFHMCPASVGCVKIFSIAIVKDLNPCFHK